MDTNCAELWSTNCYHATNNNKGILMENFIESFLQHVITFFAIIDPIGASALMLSILHKDVTKAEIREIAYKSTLTMTIAFFVVLIGGNIVLKIFGIDINSIKVMGGIILILMAVQMIHGKKENDNLQEKTSSDMTIVPIAIPITFGPAIFTTIIIVKEQTQNFTDIIPIIFAFLVNALVVYLIFRNSIYIKHYLGKTGQAVITKIMGLIVGAIAVQFIIGGSVTLVNMYLN
jgi:multiple antibiotic resistance protein